MGLQVCFYSKKKKSGSKPYTTVGTFILYRFIGLLVLERPQKGKKEDLYSLLEEWLGVWNGRKRPLGKKQLIEQLLQAMF